MSAPVKSVAVEALSAFVRDVCRACGMPNDDAEILAHCLIEAHLRGLDTHGVSCLAGYVECLTEGRIAAKPNIVIEHTLPWAIRVDGDNGMGHVVASRAMSACLDAAATMGIGVATARRSNHVGAACVYPLMAVERGCIGIAMANAAPSVAPWGARSGLMGTNPIAVAVPAGTEAPFVMDFATSTAARRKIRDAAEAGLPIPEGWAMDRDGRPTTDAKAALAGVSLPFGGAKGSALALLADILSGVLSGAFFGGDVLSFHTNTERPAEAGAFLMAIRVDAFMPLAEFTARMDELADRVHALPPAAGFENVRLPGERGADLNKTRRATGIPLKPKLVADLTALGAGFGVSFPA